MILPPELIISDVAVTNEHKTYITESMNSKFLARDTGIQRYKGTLKLTAATTDIKKLNAFVAGLKGRLNSTDITLGGTFASDITLNPKLGAAISIGNDSIRITTSVGVSLEAGSYFTIANDDKMYMLMDDISPNSTTTAEIIPSIKKSAGTNTVLNFTTPSFNVLLDSSENTINHTESGLIADITINWIENL